MMKLAFCLFNYFPFGGLQRDFIRIARVCRERGHEIHVYTMRWDGEPEPGFHVHLLDVSGWQNHTRSRAFSRQLEAHLKKEHYDRVIGFNKMPHLDLYYAADVCYAARVDAERGSLYKLLPRYRQWLALEKSVFSRDNKTNIMLISPKQEDEYIRYYQTERKRFTLLPPGIAKDRLSPGNADERRQRCRDALSIPTGQLLLLMVGSGFKTKGLDRSIRGLASLPRSLRGRCHLIVIGQDDPEKYKELARQLKIEASVRFMGGRNDVPDFLLAADLLLHPSYHENTGTAILEAIVAGLPVLTVEACGYAHYVVEANAGRVLPAPFDQGNWNQLLEEMLLSAERQTWHENGIAFSKQADLYSLPEKAADLIENMGA